MKKLLSMIAVCLMAITANAQEDYNRVSISYSPTLWTDIFYGDNMTTHGVGAQYVHGFSLSEDYPVFVEAGADFTYGFGTEKNPLFKANFSMCDVTVPVSAAYKFDLGANDMAITPFIGVHGKFNLMNKVKLTEQITGLSATIDYFDKEDVKVLGEDDIAKRFQFGGQIGATFTSNNVSLTLAYKGSFTKFLDDVSSHGFMIGIGYNF